MIKILLGGSPCTFWSIARFNQKENRETEAEGSGWELFKNYIVAKEKFKPDFFLYENNVSASFAIKEQIEKALGVKRMEIDSALVSAQSRKRFYCFNWTVKQPTDKGILFEDIEHKTNHKKYDFAKYAHTVRIDENSIKWDTSGRGNYSQQNRARKTNCKMNTLPSAGTDKNNIWLGGYKYRKIHPIEAERLQTMPDNYTEGLSTGQRIKALGNGWTAEVIIHILQGALKDVPKDEEIVVLSMYDGIGTGRYCLDKMGFKNIKYFAYEIDKYAIQIAKKNYPDIIEMGDAFQVREDAWSLE